MTIIGSCILIPLIVQSKPKFYLPWSHCRSRSQTWDHSSDHRRGTRWCQSCRCSWIFPEERRAWTRQMRRQCWSEMFRRISRQHWNVLKMKKNLKQNLLILHRYKMIIVHSFDELSIKVVSRKNHCFVVNSSLQLFYWRPVVEENIRNPEVPGLDHHTVHSSILWCVPAELIVAPDQVEPHTCCQKLIFLILEKYLISGTQSEKTSEIILCHLIFQPLVMNSLKLRRMYMNIAQNNYIN